MTEQELMYASKDDIVFYTKCINGLPNVGYSCGAHSVRCLREIIEFVKPKNILEIGFNCGHSATMWLELAPEASILSIDISDKAETIEAVRLMTDRYGSRFVFLLCDSKDAYEFLQEEQYDLIFIDGGHLEEHVMADIRLALSLNIKWLAFDDVLPEFGPGVLPSIEKWAGLKEVKLMGNIALYRNQILL
jgi:predicted O-methyltransferase YrrM